jgi:uncharacterized membrane protein
MDQTTKPEDGGQREDPGTPEATPAQEGAASGGSWSPGEIPPPPPGETPPGAVPPGGTSQEPATAGGQPGRSAHDTSTGLDPNLAGLLCYILGVVTGIVFLLIENRSSYVRFHALQSTIVFGALFVLSLVLPVIPVVGILVSLLLPLLGVVLWILLMVKAYQGERFKVPYVGDWVEQQLARNTPGG